MVKKRQSLEQKIAYLAFVGLRYDLGCGSINDKECYVLIVTKGPYEGATYWGRTVSILIGKLFKDVLKGSEPNLITKKV